MISKIIKIIFDIIGWFFVLIFTILGVAYHSYIVSSVCYFICALLSCPLTKKYLIKLKLWLRIPLVFILFVFSTIQLPETNDNIPEENIVMSDDKSNEEASTKIKDSKDNNLETPAETSPENWDEAEIILPEEDFKNTCVEIIYNDIDSEWIGKHVTKEILFTETEQSEYQCASTESFIEDLDSYQHVYTIYDIYDCRLDKSFPIYANDVIRIYGIITDIGTNYANGLDYPIIDMYYADYIREWRKPIEEAKSMEELIQERK